MNKGVIRKSHPDWFRQPLPGDNPHIVVPIELVPSSKQHVDRFPTAVAMRLVAKHNDMYHIL